MRGFGHSRTLTVATAHGVISRLFSRPFASVSARVALSLLLGAAIPQLRAAVTANGAKPVRDPTHSNAPWRAFSDNSPWNQPIAASAPVDRESDALIADLASRGGLHINIKDWSIPGYFVNADTTPKRDVGDSRPGVYGAGFEFPRQIPIPDDAVASPPVREDSDNHLCIIDRARHLEWGMWAARKDPSGRWFTGLGAVTDLAGTGVAPPWFASHRELDSHRARASGFPLIAGLILRDDIKSGRIDHALVFAYDHCRSAFFVPPASTAQVEMADIRSSRGIPMGGRIQLDPSWDVEGSALSPSGKMIARALQTYGAYCGDYAGANVIYAENSPAAVREWEGILSSDELAAVFTPEMIRRYFRVIDMGNLMPGQNLEVPPPYVLTFATADESQPTRIDQLSRTITLHRQTKDPLRAIRTTWTVFPRGTQAFFNGQPVPSGQPIEWTNESSLLLTAPNGARSTWRVVMAQP